MAKRLIHVRIARTRLQQIHGLDANIGIEALAIVKDVKQHTLHVAVCDGALHEHGVLRFQLHFDLRGRAIRGIRPVDSSDVGAAQFLVIQRGRRN